jgi:hypothetical protein
MRGFLSLSLIEFLIKENVETFEGRLAVIMIYTAQCIWTWCFIVFTLAAKVVHNAGLMSLLDMQRLLAVKALHLI